MRQTSTQTFYTWTCDHTAAHPSPFQTTQANPGVPAGWGHLNVNGQEVDLCPTCVEPFTDPWDAISATLGA